MPADYFYPCHFSDQTPSEPTSMFVCSLFKLLDMYIFYFTDGKCLSYDYQGKNSLLCKTKHVMALHAIQNVLSLYYLHFSPWLMIFTFLAYHLQV